MFDKLVEFQEDIDKERAFFEYLLNEIKENINNQGFSNSFTQTATNFLTMIKSESDMYVPRGYDCFIHIICNEHSWLTLCTGLMNMSEVHLHPSEKERLFRDSQKGNLVPNFDEKLLFNSWEYAGFNFIVVDQSMADTIIGNYVYAVYQSVLKKNDSFLLNSGTDGLYLPVNEITPGGGVPGVRVDGQKFDFVEGLLSDSNALPRQVLREGDEWSYEWE